MTAEIDRQAKVRTATNAIVTAAAVAGVLIVINFFISPRISGRLDLTENHLYTLSQASRDAVSKLDDLTVRVFISDPLPETMELGDGRRVNIRAVAQAFRDILDEYRAYAGRGMDIVYVTKNVEKEAEKAGLHPFAAKEATLEGGKLQFKRYVLGATFHYKNVKEVLPLALDPDMFEYDITRLLLRLRDKYEKSRFMKDVLDAAKAIDKAAATCHEAIANAAKSDEGTTAEGLKGLLDLAQKQGERLGKLQQAAPKIQKACKELDTALAEHGPTLEKSKNDFAQVYIASARQFHEGVGEFLKRLGSESKEEVAQAIEIQQGLDSAYDQLTTDYHNLEESPGSRTIGLVCGHGEFCPFARREPFIKQDIAMLLGQKNGFAQRLIGQAQQIEQQVNQINDAIHSSLFQRRGYDVTKVDLNDPVPDKVAGLVILYPHRKLSDRELYHLDQFIMAGKPVAFLLSRWDVSLMNIQAPESLDEEPRFDYTAIQEIPTGLDDLLRHYGVDYAKNIVMEPEDNEVVVVTQLIRKGQYQFQAQSPFKWPLLPVFRDLNRSEVLTRDLQYMVLPYVSTVEPADTAQGDEAGGDEAGGDEDGKANASSALHVDPLAYTSTRAVVVRASDIGKVPLAPPKTVQVAHALPPVGKRRAVAVVVTGEADSFFKGKDIPKGDAKKDDDGKDDDEPERIDRGKVRLLVVGSGLGLEGLNVEDVLAGFDMSSLAQGGGIDLLTKMQTFMARFRNWQIRLSQLSEVLPESLRFLFNVLDWTVQNEALIAVRSKAFRHRPLRELSDAKVAALKYANILGVPLLFIAIGLLRFALWKRRRPAWAAAQPKTGGTHSTGHGEEEPKAAA